MVQKKKWTYSRAKCVFVPFVHVYLYPDRAIPAQFDACVWAHMDEGVGVCVCAWKRDKMRNCGVECRCRGFCIQGAAYLANNQDWIPITDAAV